MELQHVFDSVAKLAQQVLEIALPIVAVFVVNWLRLRADEVKLSMSRSRFAFLAQVAESAVHAAEQMGATEQINDRKTWAIRYIQDYLTARGVKVEVSAIAAAVEAAVMREFNTPARVVSLPVEVEMALGAHKADES